MSKRILHTGGLWMVLAASPCLAQSGPDGATQPPEAAAKGTGPQVAPGRPVPKGMLMMLPAMTKELQLDEKQQAAVQDMMVKYEEATKEIRDSMLVPPEVREKTNSLLKEMAEARQAGDENRVAELQAARTELIKQAAAERAPAQEKIDTLHAQLKKDVQSVMRPEQVATFETFWSMQVDAARRGRTAPERSPRALKAALDRVEDLTAEQKQYIETVFRAHREASRQGSPDQEKVRVKKLYDDVFEVLTDGQKEHVERELRGRRGAGRDKAAAGEDGVKDPNGPAKTDAPANPEEPKKP